MMMTNVIGLHEDGRGRFTPAPDEAQAPGQDCPPSVAVVDDILRHGFELLRDLTGDAPQTFDAGYNSWYDRSRAVLADHKSARLDEFDRLYRQHDRQRIELETYTIQDYLLGHGLQGRFGSVAPMRTLIAKRFHQQISIVKSARGAMAPPKTRAKAAVHPAMEREIAAARRLADEGRHRAAGTLAATFLSDLLRSATGDDAAEPAALAGALMRDGRLDGELYARLVAADPIVRRALDGEGEVSAADADTLIACLGASATALG